MSVEAECYVLKKTRDDLLVRSYNIPSGSGEGIELFRRRSKNSSIL